VHQQRLGMSDTGSLGFPEPLSQQITTKRGHKGIMKEYSRYIHGNGY